MRSQIGNAIVFCSLPPLLKQGQTGTRVVRPKWAIEWLRVGDAMVVGHALALVAIAPQRDKVGTPIDKVRPFGRHAIAFFAAPSSQALRRILNPGEGWLGRCAQALSQPVEPSQDNHIVLE